MGKFEGRVGAWLEAQGEPGESLVSWMMLGYPHSQEPYESMRSPMDDYLDDRGLDADRQFLPATIQTFAAMTDRRLLLGSVRGAIGLKPKELLIDAPLAEGRIEWFDQTTLGPNIRHLLMFFGDQWVRTDAIANKRSNGDGFVAALGAAATQVSH